MLSNNFRMGALFFTEINISYNKLSLKEYIELAGDYL